MLFLCISVCQNIDSTLNDYIIKGIDLILKQEYKQADSLFRNVTNLYPKHPAGYLYRAAVKQAYSIDYDIPIEDQELDSLLQLSKNYAKDLEPNWQKYFIACAEGQLAYSHVESGNWISGILTGISSAMKFEEIIEQDSSFYEAYSGLGTYYYWSSKKTEFIQWLPFVKDNRSVGIKLLITGANKSVYNRFASISALISIFLDSEDYKNAEKWSRIALKFYPRNRIFLWGLATAFERQRYFKEASNIYEILLKNIQQMNAAHPYSEIVCRLNLAKSKLALQDTTDVILHLEKILSYRTCVFPKHLTERVKLKFNEAKLILNDIENTKPTKEK